jgi:SNF2 family DNA or RNA helicase
LPIVWLASGTPIPKHVGELWTVMASVFPEVAIKHGMKTHAEWLQRFAITRPQYFRGVHRDKVVGVKNENELAEILDEVMLRRTIDDVGIDVPVIDWQMLPLNGETEFLTEEDRNAMGEAVNYSDVLADIAGDPHIARMRRRIGELKVEPVLQLLRSQLADNDEKIAVFAHHTEVLRGLRDGLAQFGAVVVDGSTRDNARGYALDAFQNDPLTRVFIGQNQVTGTGMDGLQHATRRAIIVEPSWSNFENVQIAKRLARIGATERRVIVQMVSLAGTLDEAIVGQNLREAKMAAQIENAVRERVA